MCREADMELVEIPVATGGGDYDEETVCADRVACQERFDREYEKQITRWRDDRRKGRMA